MLPKVDDSDKSAVCPHCVTKALVACETSNFSHSVKDGIKAEYNKLVNDF